ncbi:hypothetical protein [Nonomuraea longicatena]|uniref:hypothetical protein n=1 Tax=Nonomuraea longicatena TaxID=83682 RepID=UPI0031D73D22
MAETTAAGLSNAFSSACITDSSAACSGAGAHTCSRRNSAVDILRRCRLSATYKWSRSAISTADGTSYSWAPTLEQPWA